MVRTVAPWLNPFPRMMIDDDYDWWLVMMHCWIAKQLLKFLVVLSQLHLDNCDGIQVLFAHGLFFGFCTHGMKAPHKRFLFTCKTKNAFDWNKSWNNKCVSTVCKSVFVTPLPHVQLPCTHILDIPESIFQLVVGSQIGLFWLLYK